MHTIISIDSAGRIVLPKKIRDRFNLVSGSELEINASGDNLTLRPVTNQLPLREEQGFLIYTGEFIEDSTSSVSRDREARARHVQAGKRK